MLKKMHWETHICIKALHTLGAHTHAHAHAQTQQCPWVLGGHGFDIIVHGWSWVRYYCASLIAQHFPLNLYPYPDHNHQQRPMPTHARP
jgi:hypothetical protein